MDATKQWDCLIEIQKSRVEFEQSILNELSNQRLMECRSEYRKQKDRRDFEQSLLTIMEGIKKILT